MRNAMPMRWIEQAEARRMLASSGVEFASTPCGERACAWAAGGLRRLGAWLAARHPLGWPAAQLEPAPVWRAPFRAAHIRGPHDCQRSW